jgi:multiple sugar transport system substrate-binding protein
MINRRTLLQASTAALVAPALARAADGGFDWKQCKGQSVVVSLSKNPRADNLQKHEKEFEALTGISVDSEQLPEQQQRTKAILELSTGRPSFDVMHYSLHVSKRIVGNGKWLEDLHPYLADKALTSPDFDVGDFSAPSIQAATQPDGRMDSFPVETDFWLIYYNKQLFDQKKIAVPKTFDEMLAAGRSLTDKATQPTASSGAVYATPTFRSGPTSCSARTRRRSPPTAAPC